MQPAFAQHVDLAAFNLVIDSLRIVVVRPVADTVADTTVFFPPDASEVQLALEIQLLTFVETFDVTLTLTGQGIELFRGTRAVTLEGGPPDPSQPPEVITVAFTGPGANVATLVVGPRDSVLSLGASLPFRVSAFDGQGLEVPQFYVAWSVVGTASAAVDALGVVTAPAARGQAHVRAEAPNGVADSSLITFIPPPTALRGVDVPTSGAVGTSLPFVVQVAAADGLGVQGIPVAFRPLTGGGNVAAAIVMSDADGMAATTVTLGPVAGGQGFEARIPGVPAVTPVTVAVAALPGPISAATSVVSVSSNTIASGAVATLTLQAKDAAGNNLTVGGANVTFNHSGGTSTGVIGPATDASDGTYTASFTGLVAGTATTIGATVDGSSVTTTLPTIVVTPGAVASVVVTPATATLTALGATQPFTAAAFDANTTPIAGAPFTWGTSNGAVASIDPVTGLATAVGNGTATVQATSAGVTGTASVTVGQVVASVAFVSQPTNTVAGVLFSPAVTVGAFDSNNNLAVNFGGDITIFRSDLIDCLATPLGTTTVTAAAGLVTFADLLFEQACPAMQLQASSGSFTSPQSDPFNVIATAAVAIVPASGDGQAATVGAPLPALLFVRVMDAFGNGVSGETVTWAVTLGGGALTPPSSVTDAGGFASSQWTMGAQPGTNVAEASSGSLIGSPVVFTATAIPLGVTALWTGAMSADWATGGNWSTGIKPGITDTVFISQGPANQPVVSGAESVGGLIVEPGATLTIAAGSVLSAAGDVVAGTTVVGPGTLELSGAGTGVQGIVPSLRVTGSVAVTGALEVVGDLTVIGAGAALDVGGQAVLVSGDFATSLGGVVTMATPTGALLIGGSVAFNGGSTAGALTAGLLAVGGDFTATDSSSAEAFAAAGTHRVVLQGAGAQFIRFLDLFRAAPPAHRFQDLEIITPAGAEAGTAIDVAGDLVISAGGLFDVGGQTVTVAGNLSTTSGGVLQMNAAADLLVVQGSATFAGGNESGRLSDGVLRIAGDFVQLGIPAGGGSFEGASLHVVDLDGTGPQSVTFEDPIGSHFGNLRISNAAPSGVTFLTDAFAAGQLQSPNPAGGVVRAVLGNGHTLRVFGLDADSLVLDNLPLVVDDGFPIARFNAVTLRNYDPSATQLTFNRAGGQVTFSDVSFLTTPILSTGAYVAAADLVADGSRFTINMLRSVPLNGVAYVFTTGQDGGGLVRWTELVYTQHPTPVVAGSPITPPVVVTVTDPLGNPVTTYSDVVSIAMGVNPGGGVLSGTTATIPSLGVATFADLTIDKAGSGYNLVVSAPGLRDIGSSPFDVAAGAPLALAFVRQPTRTKVNAFITPSVQVALQDGLGNTVTTVTDAITLIKTVASGDPDGLLVGTTSRNAVGGIATFDDLSVTAPSGVPYGIDAASGTLPIVRSDPFVIHLAETFIPTSGAPIHSAVNPNTDRIYVAVPPSGAKGGTESFVMLIDGATNTKVDSVLLSGAANVYAISVNPINDKVYVSDFLSGVFAVDGASRTVERHIPLNQPGFTSIDTSSNRVYVPATVQVVIGPTAFDVPALVTLDGATHQVVDTIHLGGINDQAFGVAFNPTDGLVYVAVYDLAHVKVVDPGQRRVIDSIAVDSLPFAVALNPASNRLYVTSDQTFNVSALDLAARRLLGTIPVGGYAGNVSVDPSGNRVYVPNFESSSVVVADGVTNLVLTTLPVGESIDGAYDARVHPRNGLLYVPLWNKGEIAVITPP